MIYPKYRCCNCGGYFSYPKFRKECTGMYWDCIPYIEEFPCCPLCKDDMFDEIEEDAGSHTILVRIRRIYDDTVWIGDFITAPDNTYHINVLATKNGNVVRDKKRTVSLEKGNEVFKKCLDAGYYITDVYFDSKKARLGFEVPFGKEA